VHDNQVTVTFPYPFLRDKLGDPQRMAEIQDALSEVLRANCRLKLVLASEHVAQQRSQPAGAASPVEPEALLDKQDLDEISRWAKERGGETKIVP
jgi:hypothetical protein